MDFAERDECKPVLLRLSLAGKLDKPLMSLYGTEWRERGYGLKSQLPSVNCRTFSVNFFLLMQNDGNLLQRSQNDNVH